MPNLKLLASGKCIPWTRVYLSCIESLLGPNHLNQLANNYQLGQMCLIISWANNRLKLSYGEYVIKCLKLSTGPTGNNHATGLTFKTGASCGMLQQWIRRPWNE